MSNTYRHNEKAKYKKIPKDNDQRWILYEKVHGYNPHNKETMNSRKISRKKFRAEEKEALYRIEKNQDDITFPLDLGTEGYDTN